MYLNILEGWQWGNFCRGELKGRILGSSGTTLHKPAQGFSTDEGGKWGTITLEVYEE